VVAITMLAAVPASASAATFSNPAPIAVPDAAPPDDEGHAPPSPIVVDGLDGTVTKARATLHSWSATSFPNDLNVLLVGPGGQSTILVADVCIPPNFGAFGPTTLTFDDEAASLVPENQPCPSGTYKPTNRDESDIDEDEFFPGAPAGPYPTALSVFNGTSPNGTWQLYASDDALFGVQTIAGGWSLELAAGTCSGLPATVPALVGTAADDTITGTPGPDVILGNGGNDTILGLEDRDVICGGPGKDVVRGGGDKDKLLGQGGKDTLRGQKGKDKLLGQGGKDKLVGGGGKDVCKGGKKDDTAKKCEVEKSI
jgi:Ca2+-binding RTX toxin-like protein